MVEPRILITRLSAIGDCILTVPLACALRRRLPGAFLAWAMEPGAASLLRGLAVLDELIVVPKDWFRSPRSVWSLGRSLRSYRFDVVLDPQSLTKSALLGWLSGARERIGLAAPVGRELALWLNRTRVTPAATHVVDRQLELLRPLGIDEGRVEFALPDDPAAEAAVRGFIQAQGLTRRFVVVNPGASWGSKLWPTESYARVVRQLDAEAGLPSVVIWAGSREREWAEAIVAQSSGGAVLAPATTLRELAALLRRACLYVGSDTGPTHLAAAVGTPCVALFGTTRPEVSGPYGSAHRCLQEYYQQGSSRERRRAANDAMRAIAWERVFEACQQVLAAHGGRAASRVA